ncbi:putative bifunctional diguanylate cyclase/phosphodiesterase [Alicyclobacillus sp. ALC3]|uniref:putative bifunctional diguanylate cyclase/phosphodiesterase n=1 Tax=Alicyclobacillus sp. ALC3 TaxID=2796143 RepID=UPI002379874D|nr:EAL domain-containing protein [Alicyclobacillus sp. ALC3]WDL98111.1 EAL domain-containing protein [Alicyclobacillus sp. ALC3]
MAIAWAEDFKEQVKVFAVLLLIEVVVEVVSYEWLGDHLFGVAWHSHGIVEYLVHSVWLMIVMTPLLFWYVRRQLRTQSRLHHDLWQMAHYDELTGLPNRRLAFTNMKEFLSDSVGSGHPMAVLLIDLDRFKQVNDSLGHDVGDEVLKIAAGRVRDVLGRGEIAARLGGDEFLVMIPAASTEEAVQAANLLLERLQEKITWNGYEFYLTASIGIALCPVSGETVSSVMKSADLAMYEAKRDGKNRWHIHMEALQEKLYSTFRLENDLRRALHEQNELFLEFQPQMNVGTNRVDSLEALIRWHHPTLGLIPPSEFIPIAEDSGLIVKIGALVLQTACAQLNEWKRQNKSILPIGVNVSQVELAQQDFVEKFLHVLSDYDIDTSLVFIEITETSLMKNEREVRDKLTQLRQRGIHVMLDDFGNGYNSLGVLRQLPIDTVKIDRTFVRDIHSSVADRSLFSALVHLAHSFSLTVLAEGVEHQQQLAVVSEERCDQYQGYLFSRPITANKVAIDYL